MPPPLWESPFCPYTPHLSDFSSEILIFFYFLVLFCSHHHYIIIIIINAVHKKEKYLNLINQMSRNYRCVRFVNLSMSSLGVFSDECSTFLDMMNDIGIDKKQQRYIIKKMINIAIRATYYIFCCRNRNRDSPDLMQFWFFFFWLLFCFVFFLCNNPIKCKLPIRSEIYNCTFKKTNQVSIINPLKNSDIVFVMF